MVVLGLRETTRAILAFVAQTSGLTEHLHCEVHEEAGRYREQWMWVSSTGIINFTNGRDDEEADCDACVRGLCEEVVSSGDEFSILVFGTKLFANLRSMMYE